MKYSIVHKTIFEFDKVPLVAVQRLHLTPSTYVNQDVMEWDIKLEGCSIELNTTDFHGNIIQLCRHDARSNAIAITCKGLVNITDAHGIIGAHDNNVPLMLFRNATSLTQAGPKVRDMGREMIAQKKDGKSSDLELLHFLSARILSAISYEKGVTTVSTTAEQAMDAKSGVCQDHVHAFLAVARFIGFSARYVSGYLMMDNTSIQEASHAWAEIYLENLGWVGFDISNSMSPDGRYIKLATGFDYVDVMPISGVRVGNGEERMSTQIQVEQQ